MMKAGDADPIAVTRGGREIPGDVSVGSRDESGGRSREIAGLGIEGVVAGVRSGAFSCVEVVNAHLERLKSVNPRINAVTVPLEERALDAARAADKWRAAKKALPVLFGVPVTVKQNTDYVDAPNNDGLRAYEHNISPVTAPVVDNLLRAGAIVIGLTNSPEFSLRWETDNPLFGATKNPWNTDYTAGGSSGGAAAATAAGIGLIAQGNDFGGSLRYPAACCGVTTIKTTPGRIPCANLAAPDDRAFVYEQMAVQGPITRTVGDLRLALQAMAAPDIRDPWQIGASDQGLDASPAPRRAALTLEGFGPIVAPEVERALKCAADSLRDAGWTVEEVQIEGASELAKIWRDWVTSQIREFDLEAIRELGSEDLWSTIRPLLDAAAPMGIRQFFQSWMSRTHVLRKWRALLTDYPVLLAPVSLQGTIKLRGDVLDDAGYERFLAAQAPLYCINVLGLPSAVVPVMLENELPVGVQLVGWRFREADCLTAASAIEERAGDFTNALWKRLNLGA